MDATIPAHAPPDSRAWRIRIGSLLIPLAHAAGMNTVTVLGLRFMTDSLAISATARGSEVSPGAPDGPSQVAAQEPREVAV